ncbi:glucokinase [uncultured Desulfovibrio sp.]|uniref:glucokinase n=1 Tax=uncultured Desulfovibrio sp. TaxID=167968 RepID=UPI002804F8A7|nr:glucokinase [uncultured Desulfovibrio sp.]
MSERCRHILAADIGGTNCRLARFSLSPEGRFVQERAVWLESASLRTTAHLLAALERELELHPSRADATVLAVAGPVDGGVCGRLTNGCLEVDVRPLLASGTPPVRVINDFVAQACACLTEMGDRARLLWPPGASSAAPAAPARLPRAVVGAGTGLGVAALFPLDMAAPATDGWLVAPSEGGHAAFPFVGEEETAFHAFLRRELRLPYARGDDVLSGRGLALLHAFLTGERLAPGEVGRRALDGPTPTLRWYARFSGRACRNVMLTTLCSGGLWITGGIAVRNPLCVGCEAFFAELHDAPAFDGWLRSVPVRLLEDVESGLWGAACYGRMLLERQIGVRAPGVA